jgi:hypothetical protein
MKVLTKIFNLGLCVGRQKWGQFGIRFAMEWFSENRKSLNPKLHGMEECPVTESEKPGLELEHGIFKSSLDQNQSFFQKKFLIGTNQCWAGIRIFLIPIESCFHTITYKRFQFSLFIFFEIIHRDRVTIIFVTKLELVFTISVLINLTTVSYHLVVLTNWLLHL